MLMAGGESVTEQLANLATGFSHKFDLKEVIVSMLSAGANAKIPGDSQLFHTALTSLGSNVATQEWETHHLDIESLAANVLGTTLGQAATNTIEKGAAEFASELKAYVEAQFASMTSGNGQTNVMPAQAGIQGNSQNAKDPNAATNSNQSGNSSSQNTSDTPSNRYAKLQKQSQDADPSSDPGNDPDANNPNGNSTNSNGSNNPSRADRGNQQAKQNVNYSSKQSSQEPAYYEKQDAQWYINQGRLAAYNGQMPDWLKNLSQTDLANFYSGYREGGIESVTASVESSLLPVGEGIFGALKFGLGFFRGVRELIPTATKTLETTGNSDVLMQALQRAKLVGDRLEAILDDGSKVIFRRDIGEHAHPIGNKYPNDTDHYNIEVQLPNPLRPGRFIPDIMNAHIIVDENLNPIDILLDTRIENYEYEILNRPKF